MIYMLTILIELDEGLSIQITFFLDFPDELTDALFKCTNNAQVKEVGIEWAIKQCKELMDAQVPSLHFYTMSKAETTYKVAKELF